MCIIVIKEKSAAFPSRTAVANCVAHNPDGFAISYNGGRKGERTRVYRTMSAARFLQKYEHIISTCDPRTTTLFLHARIATHGSTRLENTHGFSDATTHLTFAHNGILQGIKPRHDRTDSETYFRDFFVPTFLRSGERWDSKAVRDVIADNIGYSKFVFMSEDGTLHRYGEFIRDRGTGVLYSNYSFRPRVTLLGGE